MSLRDALAQSINIPSIQLSYLAGLGGFLAARPKMGITSLSELIQINTASLSFLEVEVCLSLKMTDAYGVFANDGNYVPYRSILKVTDGSGNTFLNRQTSPLRLLSYRQTPPARSQIS